MLAIDYEAEQGPTIAVRLQELFGLTTHPSIATGAVPLMLELLSPAHRPVQVTRDLPGFWRGSYAAVRSDLRNCRAEARGRASPGAPATIALAPAAPRLSQSMDGRKPEHSCNLARWSAPVCLVVDREHGSGRRLEMVGASRSSRARLPHGRDVSQRLRELAGERISFTEVLSWRIGTSQSSRRAARAWSDKSGHPATSALRRNITRSRHCLTGLGKGQRVNAGGNQAVGRARAVSADVVSASGASDSAMACSVRLRRARSAIAPRSNETWSGVSIRSAKSCRYPPVRSAPPADAPLRRRPRVRRPEYGRARQCRGRIHNRTGRWTSTKLPWPRLRATRSGKATQA